MIWTEKTILAAKLAFSAHLNQVDKLGVPYIFHLIEVSEQAKTEEETIVALLHDYLEDVHPEISNHSAKDFFEPMFGAEVSSALIALRHQPNTPYMEYLYALSSNKLARSVKEYDLKSNSNPQRLALLSEPDRIRLTQKYDKAFKFMNTKEDS